MRKYQVEYHQKFAVPLSSFCFVLIGMALALKYPGSGIGLVIGGSLVIFLGFYIMLQGGKGIAAAGHVDPAVAMYAPLCCSPSSGCWPSMRPTARWERHVRSASSPAIAEFFRRRGLAMRLRWVGVLDRYVLKQWLATFLLSAVGVPAVAVIIDLSERFGRAFAISNIPVGQILLGQVFLFPSKMAILVPAAVLFATVFTLNGMGRHSELTAVQGGGISFYRLIAPMLILATLAVPADYELQELASYSTTRQKELQHEKSSAADSTRTSTSHTRRRSGWTWAIEYLVRRRPARSMRPDRRRRARPPPDSRWTIHADSAIWNASTRTWSLRHGATYIVLGQRRAGDLPFPVAAPAGTSPKRQPS